MKFLIAALLVAFLGVIAASSSPESAYANSKMTGGDRTFKSTAKCVAGACGVRRQRSKTLLY